ncbi:MAG: hypothetical protein SGILL_002007 [Bacillariaceae sp.]
MTHHRVVSSVFLFVLCWLCAFSGGCSGDSVVDDAVRRRNSDLRDNNNNISVPEAARLSVGRDVARDNAKGFSSCEHDGSTEKATAADSPSFVVELDMKTGAATLVLENEPCGFPTVDLRLPKEDLGYMSWGSCFLDNIQWGDWRDLDPQHYKMTFDGESYGQPWIVHDSHGRTVVWSNLDNFFVSAFAADDENKLDIGLKTTLNSVPKGHRHSSILVAGSGINATVMEWGDILLKNGDVEKKRSNVYDDFTLAMLGYWTDNGAYHYVGAPGPNYDNMEEALLGIKTGMKKKNIPIRYIQWDDWWMEKIADVPGILSWTPKKDVFPSGFSEWLDFPLAMYAPEYSSENVWKEQYSWKIDGKTSIPLDPQFYFDLFQNGTAIGMKMFEQDFLCSIGHQTSLTDSDVMSGKAWLTYMDAAARDAGIKMQIPR